MGSGKTSYIIRLLRDSITAQQERTGDQEWGGNDPPKKYLVATPYLSQINRIKNEVPEAIEPVRTGKKKSENLLDLLKSKTDIIICTHELLKGLTEYALLEPYILLIDEAIDVIEVMFDDDEEHVDNKTISVADIEILIKAGCVKENEEKFLEWIGDEYKGIAYTDIYKYLKNKSLARRGNRIFKVLPPALFSQCRDTYVFTYLFDAQNMYYYCRYFSISFEYWHMNSTGGISPGKRLNESKDFPINIYDGHLNHTEKSTLTKNWYVYKAEPQELKRLQNNIYNYLRNECTKMGITANVANIIWTTFKSYSKQLKTDKCTLEIKNKKGEVSSKGNFVACTTRATNDYRKANVVVYAVNRYQKPEIQHFFEERNDIKYDNDKFALQEMLQFIWRSAIREGKSIVIYVPSERMRNLLNNWLSP